MVNIIIPVTDEKGERVSAHFGRAPYFACYNIQSEKTVKKYVSKNDSIHFDGMWEPHEHMMALGTDVVICNSIGTRALQNLQENKIIVLQSINNKTDQIVADFLKDKLDKLQVHNSRLVFDEYSKDPILKELEKAVDTLTSIHNFNALIPEVGTNIVYAKSNPVSSKDIAGIEGRIIKGRNKPLVCGKIQYESSKHLTSVVIFANRMNKNVLSAINIRGGEDLPSLFSKLYLDYMILPSKNTGVGCPVSNYLKNATRLFDAYIHPGDFGIEPTTTILDENPSKLVEIVSKLVKV
jgi:predicted fused transcriptional regulator/phosphomethylpyrimidine kinase